MMPLEPSREIESYANLDDQFVQERWTFKDFPNKKSNKN
jgi:hypothetical protein